MSVLRAGGVVALDASAFAMGFVVAAVVAVGTLTLVLRLLYAAHFRYFSFYVWALAVVVVYAALQGIL